MFFKVALPNILAGQLVGVDCPRTEGTAYARCTRGLSDVESASHQMCGTVVDLCGCCRGVDSGGAYGLNLRAGLKLCGLNLGYTFLSFFLWWGWWWGSR
jgi:hypothetical protein